MKVRSLVLAAFGALCASSAHAIHINNSAFTANGGDPNNLASTAPNVFDQLRTASDAPHFAAVGAVGQCTGTWLGTEQGHAWVLTAAQCASTPLDQLNFRDRHGRMLAEGYGGQVHLHPGGADIALLKLPLLPFADRPLPPSPKLYDRPAEIEGKVALVGHGSVGVGNAPVDAFWPKQGVRRAWGEMRLDRVQDNGNTGIALFVPGSSATQWARAGLGDNGAAWWQYHDGEWSIVAVTNGGNATSTSSALVEKHASWIKSLYPGVRLASDTLRVTETKRFVSHNYALDAAGGQVYYLVAKQQVGVIGPTARIWLTGKKGATTELTVPVRNAVTGETRAMKLRARRVMGGCTSTYMENGVSCADGGRHGRQEVWHDPADNPGFPQGQWLGRVKFEAHGWHAVFLRAFEVDIDVMVGTRAKVTRTQRYQSPNFALEVDHGTVSYLIAPNQPGVVGPTQSIWRAGPGVTLLTVPAVNAETGQTHALKLRAQRFNGCGGRLMENAIICYSYREGPVHVWFEPGDNPSLPAGMHRGKVHIDARGWHRPLHRHIRIDVEIDTRT